jgi:hypothetical protein
MQRKRVLIGLAAAAALLAGAGLDQLTYAQGTPAAGAASSSSSSVPSVTCPDGTPMPPEGVCVPETPPAQTDTRPNAASSSSSSAQPAG